MKVSNLITHYGAVTSIAFGLAICGLNAQTVTTTTTKEISSEGTISSFEPNNFIIRSEAGPGPMTYVSSTTTRYVDEAGAPVAREMIRPGIPVTVYYIREGDRLLANRVIVHHRSAKEAREALEHPEREAKREAKREKEAREHPEREARREVERGGTAVVVPQEPPAVVGTTTTTTTTTTEGTVSSLEPDHLVVRNLEGDHPLTYRYSKTTEYVDEAGTPVSVEVLRAGVPVTVHYIREGDGLTARRVIVHRRGAVEPARPIRAPRGPQPPP